VFKNKIITILNYLTIMRKYTTLHVQGLLFTSSILRTRTHWLFRFSVGKWYENIGKSLIPTKNGDRMEEYNCQPIWKTSKNMEGQIRLTGMYIQRDQE
jgi:hypothetical protein